MMSRYGTNRQTVDELLAACTPEVYILALRLRRLILGIIPAPIEQVKSSAKLIGYGYDHTYAGQVCALALYRSYLILLFIHGVGLPDPEHLLQGTSKHARYLTIQTRKEIDNPALRLLLDAAVDVTLAALNNMKV